MRRSGQWKGSEATLTGFAQFVESQPGSTAVLVLIDSADSRDRDAARRLIAELGIASHVRWARPPNGERFVTTEMAALYDRADVVLGEFGVGWFGYVVLEAAATGTPVVSHVDARAMAELYPWHPILDSLSPAGIAERLEELARSLPRVIRNTSR